MTRASTPKPVTGAVTIPQYSVGRILSIWALATLPMGLGAWVLAPKLADRWNSDGNGLLRALLVALTIGLAWQCLIVIVSVAREQGTLRWSVVREALWLVKPTSPRTGQRSGRVFWMVVPALVILAALQAIPALPGIEERDFAKVLDTETAQEFFLGNWGWFALVIVMLVLNTVVGEELLFRGLLLPRMVGKFGRGAWAANSVIFAAYHVHLPWTMPGVLLSSTVFTFTTQRYRSAWFGILTHSAQAVIVTVLLLGLVLGVAP